MTVNLNLVSMFSFRGEGILCSAIACAPKIKDAYRQPQAARHPSHSPSIHQQKFLSAGLTADRPLYHCATDGFLPVAAHRRCRPRPAARSSSCCCYRRRRHPRPDVGAAPG